MGSGIGSIESTIENIFREANSEILITTYAISNAADMMLDWFEAALSRGVSIRMVINRIHEQPTDVISRLEDLYRVYPHFYLYSFEYKGEYDLHAKVIVADRNQALVGSSNLSRRGLLANHELALWVKGKTAEDVASSIEKIFASTYVSLVNR